MKQPKKKRTSQAQIAQQIGCSQALVSMALNGRTKGISEHTYNAIRELAAQEGYLPKGMKIDPNATGSEQMTIGYILRSPLKLANKSNFFSHIHQGLHEHLSSKKMKTVYLGSEEDLTNPESTVRSHIGSNVKAIAVMGEIAPKLLSELQKLDRPIVYISARATGQCHSVLSNEFQSAELIVDHLFELGHRKFAWIGGKNPKGRHDERFSSLQNALRNRGIDFTPHHIATLAAADRNEGYEGAKQIHKSCGSPEDMPTALVTLNALMARGAMNYFYQNSIVVGTDISIAAFDMTRVCQEERPEITSAGADPELMGHEAGRILLQSIEENIPSLTDLTLPTKLVVRDTTGSAKLAAQAQT